MGYIGGLVGVALMSLALGDDRRGFAARLAAGLSWLVMFVGLVVHSLLASSDWAWSAWNGLLVGGVVGVAAAALKWLFLGARSAARFAKSDSGAKLAERPPWLVAGVVALVAGVGAWWFFGADGPPNEAAALVADGAGPSCLCSDGAQCTGPRGGVYCLSEDGVKRYKPKGNKQTQ